MVLEVGPLTASSNYVPHSRRPGRCRGKREESAGLFETRWPLLSQASSRGLAMLQFLEEAMRLSQAEPIQWSSGGVQPKHLDEGRTRKLKG